MILRGPSTMRCVCGSPFGVLSHQGAKEPAKALFPLVILLRPAHQRYEALSRESLKSTQYLFPGSCYRTLDVSRLNRSIRTGHRRSPVCDKATDPGIRILWRLKESVGSPANTVLATNDESSSSLSTVTFSSRRRVAFSQNCRKPVSPCTTCACRLLIQSEFAHNVRKMCTTF